MMRQAANTFSLGESRVPPRLHAPAKGNYFLPAAGIILVVVLAVVLFLFDPGQHGFYPRCFFHEATGLQCPGCGALRAGHQLLHRHVRAALHLNALLVISLPVLAGVALWKILRWRRGGTSGIALRPAWIWMVLGVSLGFTVLRNFPAFAFLSP